MDTVDLWVIPLDRPEDETRVAPHLDSRESARADGLAHPRRGRFVVARGATREILSGYTGVEPKGLVWRVGQWGKPYVELRRDTAPVPAFNLSHCGAVALLAVLRNGRREVGADIERVVGGRAERLVERFFHPDEARYVRGFAPAGREVEATRLWTRKEAYAKASGHRLLDVLRIPVLAPRPGRRPGRGNGAGAGAVRRLRDVPFGDGWAVSVAVMGCADFDVTTRRWPEGR
ncbi:MULTISPECIES: 4'-phosphopantetheinyl transferase family protein [unclassified Streptomyces]|uniref:4'-phosphopantetheinyl transferase family protein n=1 Tax=unclassified Streptomyces TaxID=2593676 RepID=UPI001314C59A|nr:MULTISPECIES: 4'-phosphopantetheinyl transferase superfamily protein [unclassified Streptomyces]